MKQKDHYNFSSRPPAEILQEMNDLKKRKDHGEPIDLPMITVMYSKNSMSGFLVDFRKDNNGNVHLMMSLAGSSDVFFAEVEHIEGLIVHDIDKIDYLLYDVDMDNIALKKHVSRYEVKKRISEEAGRLASYFEKDIRLVVSEELLDQSEGFYIKNIVTDLTMILLNIGDAQKRKSAIGGTIDEIVLRKGPGLSVRLDSKSLSFTDTFTRSYSTNLQRSTLAEAIREVL